MNPVFELMDYEEIDRDHIVGTYNGISIVMDDLMESFRISDLFKNLKLPVGNDRLSNDVAGWKRNKVGSTFYNDPLYHDSFYKDKGSRVAGWYAPMVLFNAILYSIEPIKAQKWVTGLEWQEPVKGEIYFIQSSDCIGTDIYKYGMTWNTDQRYIAYGTEKVEYRKVKVLNIHAAEKILKKHYEQAFGEHAPKGKEYFTIKNIEEGKAVFDKALAEIRNKGM